MGNKFFTALAAQKRALKSYNVIQKGSRFEVIARSDNRVVGYADTVDEWVALAEADAARRNAATSPIN